MLRSLALSALLLLNSQSTSLISEQVDSCSHRALTVFVKDSQGEPVKELGPSDLEAKIHGEPVKVLSIAPDARPHRIVLIVDTTHSTDARGDEPPRWRWQFALARHFFEANNQKAKIALLIFSKRINDVVDFSQGNDAVQDRLKQAAKGYNYVRKDAEGPTTLHDAILQGLRLFDRPTSADSVYALTDAVDYNAASLGAGEIIQRYLAARVRLFAVLLEHDFGFIIKPAEEKLGPEELAEIARRSGGAILSTAEWHDNRVNLSANSERTTSTQETLTRLYRAIFEDSVVEIELPSPADKDVNFQLKLSDPARQRLNRAQIIYSDKLIGCRSNSSRN